MKIKLSTIAESEPTHFTLDDITSLCGIPDNKLKGYMVYMPAVWNDFTNYTLTEYIGKYPELPCLDCKRLFDETQII